ncbi:hypothetical protein Leryth_020506 [Lithospermum erythrorhizon]|nr:hypothetical protein Leryth_020506 [Lithospermum erythrorhizon]
MSDYMPPEILFNIFLKLPSNTVRRFLTVSKPCMYPPLVAKFGIYQVVRISNGLICLLRNLDHKFNIDPFLWNPAIDMFVQLPPPGISRICPDMYALGFWFDSKTSDFKVMRIVYRLNKEVMEGWLIFLLIEVYLNTGEWRKINVDGVQCYMPYGSWYQYAYVNGRSHWIGCRYAPDHCLIMSFDLNDEVVREILLPSDLASMNASHVMIRENMGCLVVIGDDLYGGSFRVWVMKEYGVFGIPGLNLA